MLRRTAFELMSGHLSRRQFLAAANAVGVGAAAAGQLADRASAMASDEGVAPARIVKGGTGGRIACEHLREWGVTHVFGNTGAYEAGFLDALVDYPDIQYVLGLHEGPVMAMADGYARATGRPSFVNIHSITGAANALGFIVNAFADNSPVVISVGLSAASGENLGVFTESFRTESIADLYTKLAFRVSNPQNLAESLRRAFRLAEGAPPGPVFVGIGSDVLGGAVDEAAIFPRSRSAAAASIHPSAEDALRAAQTLAAARNPLLVAGAELSRWGGLKELAAIAEKLGALVSGDSAASRSSMGFPPGHPLYLGAMRGPAGAAGPVDVVLLAGASRLTLGRGRERLIPETAHVIEIGIREDHLARNYPVDQLIFADARETLAAIDRILGETPVESAALGRRRAANEKIAQRRRAALEAELRAVWNKTPIAPERLAAELNRLIEPNAIIVTEGVSSDRQISDYIAVDAVNGERTHLISSGGSLGWGVGAAVGAKIAAPARPVVALTGDGSFQFGLQALWTAQRRRAPVTVVIFNNHGYQANRWAIAGLKGRGAATGRYIGIDIGDPDIDHVKMAAGYGAGGERVIAPEDVAPAMARARAASADGKSYVIDVVIGRRGPGAEAPAWRE
jgi:benzoylformate decarboxylase